MCLALHKFGFSDLFNSPVQLSAPFVNDFNRRSIGCEQHDFYIKVVYTEHRFDAGDDASCRSYGLTPGANPAYANCRLQLRAQRAGAAQTQQVIEAQEDADRVAAWRNLAATGAKMQQQPQPRQPTITNCTPFSGGVILAASRPNQPHGVIFT